MLRHTPAQIAAQKVEAMASSTAETAVRNYLIALNDPSSLRDETTISELENRIERSEDRLERVRLRQQLRDAQSPSIERYENEFVTHAKSWAEEQGVTAEAFAEEGVPDAVLRRAGLRAPRRGAGRRSQTSSGGGRTRVSADTVREAIPSRGTFTINSLQELTGASVGMIRSVVQDEEKAGTVRRDGTDPDHTGPGRAPTLYRRG
jgi:hypothetical protein